MKERLSVYGQYDYLRDLFAGIEQRHVAEAGLSFRAVESARHKVRLDGGLGLQARGPAPRRSAAVGHADRVGHFDSGLEVSHTIRYSADPPIRFETTDRMMAISLVAKLRRP